ncbi:MAG TPA: HDOD domain-containing protein [Fimbriimonadaceae bacterium]|nr:HDOD domain-containing protein [Fimbriimonadaceae bacterium]HRJ33590.1 HDOD domain-containing protein [Fimbriimonadaceae bacterium]
MAMTIEDILQKTTDLPTIPAAALRVIQEADLSSCTASTVASTISTDQSLTAKVLRLSNSAYYGLSREIVDLQEAVVVLGMRCVRNLAMVAATYPWMSKALTGYSLEPRAMWTHSFGTAVGAQLIAQRARIKNDDTAFTAGLLHDLGKVALSVWLEKRFNVIVSVAERESLPFNLAEKRVLGFDHTEVGYHLAKSWNIPDTLALAIRYHHAPSESPVKNTFVDCVHVGDYLTMTMGFGLGGDGLHYEFDEDSLDRLGLSFTDLDAIMDAFVHSYHAYDSLFQELSVA